VQWDIARKASHDSSVRVLFLSGKHIGQKGSKTSEDSHAEHNYESDPEAGGIGALIARWPKCMSVSVAAHRAICMGDTESMTNS